MSTGLERAAHAICDDVVRRTGGERLHWVMLREVAERLGLDDDVAQVAVRHAIEEGWLTGEGEPVRTVCLPPSPLQQLS